MPRHWALSVISSSWFQSAMNSASASSRSSSSQCDACGLNYDPLSDGRPQGSPRGTRLFRAWVKVGWPTFNRLVLLLHGGLDVTAQLLSCVGFVIPDDATPVSPHLHNAALPPLA